MKSCEIKRKLQSGAYNDFTLSLQTHFPTDGSITGKHVWNNINTQVFVQQRPNLQTGRCGICGRVYTEGMGIPVSISKDGEFYVVEVFVPVKHDGYCSFECTFSALLELSQEMSYELLLIESKRNLFALYASMYPGEQELQQRQPLGMPQTEEVLFSPHMMRFRQGMPLIRYVHSGHSYSSQ